MKSLIPLMLLVVGCAVPMAPTPPDYEAKLTMSFVIDEDFKDTEIAMIIASGESWEAATNNRVKINFTIGPAEYQQPWTIAKLDRLNDNLYEGITGATRNYVGIGTQHIFDTTKYVGYDTFFSLAITHELGHVLGLNHETDNHCAMFGGNANETAALGITTPQECDLKQFNKLYPIM